MCLSYSPLWRNMAKQNEDGAKDKNKVENRISMRIKRTEQSLVDPAAYPSDHSAETANQYVLGNVLGNGSFGVVCNAIERSTGLQVAIKRVIQDPKYKNRELAVMQQLSHPNIVQLKDYYYTEAKNEEGEPARYLNVVMEYIPDTVNRVMKTFLRINQSMPMLLVKVYTFQLCRSLGYLHCLGICHRDVKPQNLLVDSHTHVLKLCDFGSSKKLLSNEASVSYICSRFYRAPELILGAQHYSTAIDTWSVGCVLGELLLGRPLFPGESGVEQLVKIIQILGTPTKEQLTTLSPAFSEFQFPDVKAKDLQKVFGANVPAGAIDLLSQLLRYEPESRLQLNASLAHEFFDELRDASTRLPSGKNLPDLFSFTNTELSHMSPKERQKIIPPWFNQKICDF